MKYLPILAIVLAGCATTPPKPEVIEVDRPVAINCIKEAPVRPYYKTEHLPVGADNLAYADALANDWLLSRVYEDAMEKAVRACLVK